MKVITVSPVVRGVLKEELIYFSKEPVAVGTVVMVPVRTREMPAIVLGSQDVSNEKSTLKSSDFAIRKITRAKPRRIWLPEFLKAVEATANFSAQKFGETLLFLTPKTILDAHLEGELDEPSSVYIGTHYNISAIQSDTNTRMEAYQRLVRESFVRQESIFVCVPNALDVERISKILSRGIEDYSFSFHSTVTKRNILLRWKNALTQKHAILVVGTAQYLALPRYFKSIILDEEHSPLWKTMVHPRLDIRAFVEEYARAVKCSLTIGAPVLRAETHERIANGAIEEFGRIAIHTRADTKTSLIDPRREEKLIKESTGKREMVILSAELRTRIQNALEKKEHILLLSARKGLSPITNCSDCGTLVRCPQCDTPLVIHKKEIGGSVTANIFICHGCGFTRAPENNVNEVCPNCDGWKLQGVGIGIDRINDEVARLFPDAHRFILDGARAKTKTQAKKIITQFEKSTSGILIATPMAIPLLDTIPHTAIISIDSLFAIPDIRMSERIFALILTLREKTSESLLVQTRADDTTLFEQALAGNLLEFTENELALRKMFSYPPYGAIIKITVRGKCADVTNEMNRLKAFFENYSPIVPDTMSRELKNIFRMHLILKLTRDGWPSAELLAKLRALPMQFIIEVNPDHLL